MTLDNFQKKVASFRQNLQLSEQLSDKLSDKLSEQLSEQLSDKICNFQNNFQTNIFNGFERAEPNKGTEIVRALAVRAPFSNFPGRCCQRMCQLPHHATVIIHAHFS